MKRADLTPREKAVDDVLSTAMALAHQMQTKGIYTDSLREKFLRAARRLKKRSVKR